MTREQKRDLMQKQQVIIQKALARMASVEPVSGLISLKFGEDHDPESLKCQMMCGFKCDDMTTMRAIFDVIFQGVGGDVEKFNIYFDMMAKYSKLFAPLIQLEHKQRTEGKDFDVMNMGEQFREDIAENNIQDQLDELLGNTDKNED